MQGPVRDKILRELNKGETLHLRELIVRTGLGLSELKGVLSQLVAEGLVEEFRHGGYTFYRLTETGRGQLMKSIIEKKLEREERLEEEGSEEAPD